MAGDYQGSEQLARAWLLLLHLDLWRTWNADPASPFHGLVDLDHVALMGHSRGGEAASVAASLTSRSEAPVAGLVLWPANQRVRAVVAIAPSDGQFGSPVVLEDTDLLELQGRLDADVRGWVGRLAVHPDDGHRDAFKPRSGPTARITDSSTPCGAAATTARAAASS